MAKFEKVSKFAEVDINLPRKKTAIRQVMIWKCRRYYYSFLS